MNTNQTVAIIIPCYNEAIRLEDQKFLDYASANPNFDIWFVNDGSTDGTMRVLQGITTASNNIFILDFKKNKGKAEAIRLAALHFLENEKYSYLAFIDADLSAPLTEINSLHQLAIEQNKLIVAGARVKLTGKIIVRNKLRHYLGRIFATYYDSILKLRNYDTQCGLKIFDARLAKKIFNEPFVSNWFFDIEIFLRARKILGSEQYNLQILEEPLNEWKEVKGSKLKLLDFLTAPFEILKIYKKYK